MAWKKFFVVCLSDVDKITFMRMFKEYESNVESAMQLTRPTHIFEARALSTLLEKCIYKPMVVQVLRDKFFF